MCLHGSTTSQNKLFCGSYVQHGMCFVHPVNLCMRTYCLDVCDVMKPNGSEKALRCKPPEATNRKHISLKDKLNISEQVEKGKKMVDGAVAFSLSKQTVNTIISAKEAISAKKVSGNSFKPLAAQEV